MCKQTLVRNKMRKLLVNEIVENVDPPTQSSSINWNLFKNACTLCLLILI